MQANYSHKNIGFKRASAIARVGEQLKLFGTKSASTWDYNPELRTRSQRSICQRGLTTDQILAQLRDRGLLIND